MWPKPLLIMAGGTGGHVFPALAVADYLRGCGVQVVWLGTQRGLESRVVPQQQYRLLTLDAAGLRGSGAIGALLAPVRLLWSLAQAVRVLLHVRPGAVLGMGGFASGAGGLAAWLLRIPLLIHEQNALAGLTNRILYRLARVVMQGFPATFPPGQKVHSVGNPVRAAIAALPGPEARGLGSGAGPLRLLVLGGSQGARVLNTVVPAALDLLGAECPVQVLHQCGPMQLPETESAYGRRAGRDVRIVPFIDDMAGAYARTDLALCRAGALTLAELCAAGIGSILVPYPHAADDHQFANARHIAGGDAAVLLPEAELNAPRLAELLRGFHGRRDRLLAMAVAARRLSRPDAARAVGEICMEALRA
ncbi:MAG: undecaprenyldiphospho-muramoylpentapeptide beta-N-acetylglucosaminyltransferase [Gammaproteobacteria bacterium]|nr:undecaprenyldiphospho-muramoylpentapeptide beta-N-acetylglucosaminyltransferase [Gammaproteobacteria bacterium]